MRWRWAALWIVANGCGDNTHIPQLVELTREGPTYATACDDHDRLWATFTNATPAVFGGAHWQAAGGPIGASMIASDTIADVVVSNGSDIWRVKLDPPSAVKVEPPPVFPIARVAVLPGGVLLVEDTMDRGMETFTPGDTTWRASSLAFAAPPWQSPAHELIGVTTNGNLVSVTDGDAREVLATGLDVKRNVRVAGQDRDGRALVYDDEYVYAVVDGVLEPLDVDWRDYFLRVIATPDHVVAVVLRVEPGHPGTPMLVEVTEDGTLVIDDGGLPRTSAAQLRADPSGRIYVVDGGWIGVIAF